MDRIDGEKELEKLWRESEYLVLKFTADWCGPCKMMEPVLEEVERKNPKVKFVEVEIDMHPESADLLGIQAVPTLLFVRKGFVVGKAIGVEPRAELERRLRRLTTPRDGVQTVIVRKMKRGETR